jgi:hypothetical protein
MIFVSTDRFEDAIKILLGMLEIQSVMATTMFLQALLGKGRCPSVQQTVWPNTGPRINKGRSLCTRPRLQAIHQPIQAAGR